MSSDSSSPSAQTSFTSVFQYILRLIGFQPQSPNQNENSSSTLLQLPAELRAEIFHTSLLHDSTIPLLLACQQVQMEVQPMLYHRPVKFDSQAKLFDWARKGRASDLKHVTNLTLRLTDIDLSSLLDPNQPKSRPNSTAWLLYEQELQRFDHALAKLPNLREITIVPPRIVHSQFLRGLYLSVLNLLPRRFPSLRLLVIHDDSNILDTVATLQGLPKVKFVEPPVRSKPSRRPRSTYMYWQAGSSPTGSPK